MDKKIKLYRYISFEDFINLLVNNKERYVRPSYWDDKYEGYIYSHMETPSDVRRLVSEMYYNLCPRNYYAVPNNFYQMWHSKWFTYAQCWSRHKETDAMWRCYSYNNKAIRIRTRSDKLLHHIEKIFPKDERFNIILDKVSYDLSETEKLDKTINQMKESLRSTEAYFLKRPVFRHEGEWRLLIIDNTFMETIGLSSMGVHFKIEENVEGKSHEEIIDYLTEKIISQRPDWGKIAEQNVIIVDTGDIREYIDGVMVHPLAPKWYVEIVKQICHDKNIKFDGQSQIYELKEHRV